MKNRITLTIDPSVVKQAKKVAHASNTSVSRLVEKLLRSTADSRDAKKGSFVDRWAGKFVPAKSSEDDARMAYLKTKHKL